LKETIGGVIDKMPNEPVINTLIGATNLETGRLDVFDFSKLEKTDQKTMLMATSAIPVVFPPVKHMGALYADGGTLSNELLVAMYPADGSYLNITYITPSESSVSGANITSIKDMALRTFQIVAANFNDPIATLNQECEKPVGEINKYYVAAERLTEYNELDFDNGTELIDIGYQFAEKRTYKIC
jgi:predicted acylesterase/phospholipase RssA